MKKLIEALLESGFAVAVHDFPGHGLSTGKQASIEDFSEYVTVLENFLRLAGPLLPQPFHLIGQSTGSSVALEYLFTTGPSAFEKVILLSPLVRSVYWNWSLIGQSLADPFVDEIPRVYRVNSSDPAYQEFIENDPLQSRKISLTWSKALREWEERIQDYGMTSQRVMILQGTGDDVVDWRYNLPFLMGKVEVDTAILINGARHQLTNERAELRSAVLDWIVKYLEEKRT
jgi:lysophospholipase